MKAPPESAPGASPPLSRRRRAVWIVGGLVAPGIAFGCDAFMQVDPLIWGSFDPFTGAALPGLGLRQVLVYALLGLSMVGLVLALFARDRGSRALALPLLALGILLAGAHALVFGPLLPVSVIGIVAYGLGLLGLTPYLALGVFVDAFRWVARDQLQAAGRGWTLVPPALVLVPLVLSLVPLEQSRRGMATLRAGGSAAVSAGFRELGPWTPFLRGELRATYDRLDGEAQLRFRNLYLEEFGSDVHADLGGRVR